MGRHETPPLDPWLRNFLAVWPGLFAVSAGLTAVLPTLPFFLEETFGIQDPEQARLWAGLVFAAGPLTSALVGPVWGVVGDRYGRKPMVLRSMLAIAVVNGLMPFAPGVGWLVALRAVQGLLAGYVAPAIALVTAEAPAQRQGLVIARLQLAMALGMLLGPAIGAEASAWFGRAQVFHVTAILCLLATVPVVAFAREDRKLPRGASGLAGVGAALRDDLGALLGNRVFLGLLAWIFVMRIGQNMIEPMLALWIRELGPLPWLRVGSETDRHVLDRTTALAFMAVAVAQFLCTPMWGRLADRYGPLRVLAVDALGLGVCYVATVFVPGIEVFLLVRFASALFMSGSMTLAYAAGSKRMSAERRSLAFSAVQSCIQFGLSFGPIFAASVAGVLPLRTLFGVAGACLLVAGVGMLWLRRLGSVEPRPDAPRPVEETP